MNNYFKNIGAFLMLVLLLLSTTSFKIGMHFCGDTLVDVAFLSNVEKCASESTNDDANSCAMKLGCCDDITINSEGIQELKKAEHFGFNVQTNIDFFVYKSEKSFNEFELTTNKIVNQFSPPNLIRRIYILNCVHLL